MLLIKIIITSIFLFLGSKYLKLQDKSFATALKVSLLYGVIIYIFSSIPAVIIFSYLLIIYFIKYFYKLDFKKSVFLWLFTILATITTILTMALFEALYGLIT